jgi:hypothetical protein
MLYGYLLFLKMEWKIMNHKRLILTVFCILCLFRVIHAQPQILALSPSSEAEFVPLDCPLEITFDMPVTAGAGLVELYNQYEELFESIPASAFTIDGPVASYQPMQPFEYNNFYYSFILENAFHDGAENYLPPVWDWSFWTPFFQIEERQPADDAVDVSVTPSIQFSFNRPPSPGPGSIVLRDLGDNSVFAEFPASACSIIDSTVSLTLPGPLSHGRQYDVEIANDCFHDGEDNYFPGIYYWVAWTFTTLDLLLTEMSPTDDAAGVETATVLSLQFNDPVFPGPGNVRIRQSSNSALVEEIAAANLSFEGGLVIIDPASFFDYSTGYYVEIDSNAIQDAAGQFFEGFIDPAAWNFSTTADFTLLPNNIWGVRYAELALGDVDNDGDLDILLAGSRGSQFMTTLYCNDQGIFTNMGAGLPGVESGGADWGDMDNDGDLDLILTGKAIVGSYYTPISRIYRNDNGNFIDLDAALTGVWDSEAAWGDYDNDGDLDLLLSGEAIGGTSYIPITRIYRNDDGLFTDIVAGLPGIEKGSSEWGDYDNDGDLDLILTGYALVGYSYSIISRIYRNDEGLFTDIGAGLPAVEFSSAKWGDMDNDGDLDIMLHGRTSSFAFYIFRNDLGSFTNTNPGIPGFSNGDAQWGDMDNDGDLDILVTGISTSTGELSQIYRNDDGSFVNSGVNLMDLKHSAAAWGDLDNDGDLDVVLSGADWTNVGFFKIYVNHSPQPNAPPQSPNNLQLLTELDNLFLSWNPGTDIETPAAGLSYNLRIGTPDHPISHLSGHAAADGHRLISALGNMNQASATTLELPFLSQEAYPQESRTILAAVQSIDHGWSGSEWFENTVEPLAEIEYLELSNSVVMAPQDALLWDLRNIEFLVGFELQISLDPGFDPLLLEQWIPFEDPPANRDLIIGTMLADLEGFALIQQDVTHHWRMRPIYTDQRRYTVFSETPGEFILVSPPTAPQRLQINVIDNDVSLNWQATPGDFVYYIVYSSIDPNAAFPEGWQVAGAPTFEMAWVDPEQVEGQKFYKVKAVVIE